MPTLQLRGLWVPLVTPFTGGAVDHGALRRLTETLAGTGIAGFVVGGSTGEAMTLSEDEQLQALQTVLHAAHGLPVLAGVSGVATASVREAMQRRAHTGVAGFLVSAPFYVRPSQAGLVEHFRGLADGSPLPVVLYDVPARTGVRIETATMLRLAEHPRIVGVKDCSSDAAHLHAMLNDGRLQVLCGNDDEIFSALCAGAAGAIAASAHLRPELFVALHRAIDGDRLAEARHLWQALWPLTRALFTEPNPAPLKAALAQRHALGNELRAPMTTATPACTADVDAALADIERRYPLAR